MPRMLDTEAPTGTRLRDAIAGALPGAVVEVRAAGAGHFELRVVAEAFRGRSRLQQQQLVYAAIAPLMAGDAPPVHAIDHLATEAP
ncbi:MAG: BolA/IbaG family iron-sulfur metabolism protein [Deltaproteobacteria bacterium]|nr:BolA/IbaG family iron-sulfur metabolism protein [Deltaproteobacteria bacterium]